MKTQYCGASVEEPKKFSGAGLTLGFYLIDLATAAVLSIVSFVPLLLIFFVDGIYAIAL